MAAAAPGDPVSRRPGAARTVLSADDITRIVSRMAHQILEKTTGGAGVVLLGIPTRGVPLAHRLVRRVHAVEGVDLPVGSLDPTMYRDDLRLRGVRPLEVTEIPDGGVDGKVVILVDDVLFSGRTVRAALDALAAYGRPRAVQLAVLVDRGHRELPIRADYVGKNMPTSRRELVAVRLREVDGGDGVLILPPTSGPTSPSGPTSTDEPSGRDQQ
ncbi:bifunctional pyr operon transcriptional regulator/uracil phosphoribosyltransferase PyrR [Candidatus Frankia nodulisporulans]|uniref:bifunctional pyr operon transcriptional regulator/uracil phosphoribosyltransferase PyrR n=1 Tax=Candidatus Frankia nodulisporulans TaxID=2060052 RepID=UPI001CDC6B28|nr:bifunctional pyr operon transcriptional regulator/uracil phosphoribosyltransferase PyrR [Candidatus Frankia nodulisporulans]